MSPSEILRAALLAHHPAEPPPPPGDDLLGRARRDAHSAMIGHDSLPAPEHLPALRHPLDPSRTRPIPGRGSIDEAWEKLRADVEAQPDELAWYTFMRGAQQGPLANLPGSWALPDFPFWAERSLTAALALARQEGDAALLYLHVGPVQSFITTARRTQDLWVGSFTVAWMAWAATEAVVHEAGPAAILLPALPALPLARKRLFGDEQDAPQDRLQPSLANKVLAIVPRARAEALAEEAAKKVRDAWRSLATQVRDQIEAYRPPQGWDTGWNTQIDDLPEVSSVILPWPEDPTALVEQLLRPLLGDEHRPAPAQAGALFGDLHDLLYRLDAASRLARPPAGRELAQGGGREKCTLCGVREQMGPVGGGQLGRSREFWEGLARKLHPNDAKEKEERESIQLADGERLCAVCLTRRFAPQWGFGANRLQSTDGLQSSYGFPAWDSSERHLLRYPSVASIASAPFRRWVKERAPEEAARWDRQLRQASSTVDFTPPANLLCGLGPVGRTGTFLDHDGSWSYEEAYEPERAWRDHRGRSPGDDDRAVIKELTPTLQDARRFLRATSAKAEVTPSPYYAALVFDGDRFGDWLTGNHLRFPTTGEVATNLLRTHPHQAARRPFYPALQADLGQRLARLSTKTLREVVDQHLGCLVYSGGDDVLALLPLATALACARDLRDALRDTLGGRVGMSGAIFIAHHRDPLQDTLRRAREHEKKAKKLSRELEGSTPGDALCVAINKRSGEDLHVTLPWTFGGKSAVEVLLELASRKLDGEPFLSGGPIAKLEQEAPLWVWEEKQLYETGGDRRALQRRIEERFFLLLRSREDRFPPPVPPWIKDVLTQPYGARLLTEVLRVAAFFAREAKGLDLRAPLPRQETRLPGAAG
jgi:CRISPR-associated protein Cmr2